MTPSAFCGTFLQGNLCQLDDVGRDLTEWSIHIDESNTRPANESKKAFPGIRPDHETLTIVHITDTHSDPLYVVGSLADCDERVCCREGVLVRVSSNYLTIISFIST